MYLSFTRQHNPMLPVIYPTSINLPAPGVDVVSLMSPRPPITNFMLPDNLGSVGSPLSDLDIWHMSKVKLSG